MTSLDTPPAPVFEPLRRGASIYGGLLGSAGGQQVTSVACGHGRTSILVSLYASPAYRLQVAPLGVSRLSINLTAARVTGGMDGEHGRSFEAKRHSLFLTPAGAGTRWIKSTPSRHLNIYFRGAEVLDGGQDDLAQRLEREGPIFNLVLPDSGPLIRRLALEMAEGCPFAVEAVDGLALLLLVKLARRRLAPSGRRLMTAQRMALVDDYIAANLGERILVGDLAAAAGLPPGRFAHAFTRHTGRTPHQYVLWQRVEQATAMLREGRGSLAEVAAACGFASQQHMTSVLKARLGLTPAALRGAAAGVRPSR